MGIGQQRCVLHVGVRKAAMRWPAKMRVAGASTTNPSNALNYCQPWNFLGVILLQLKVQFV